MLGLKRTRRNANGDWAIWEEVLRHLKAAAGVLCTDDEKCIKVKSLAEVQVGPAVSSASSSLRSLVL